MPSLRMKKSRTDCLRARNGLWLCQKSNLISKRSCCHAKISQLVGTFTHNCQDVPSSNETTHDMGIVEPIAHQEWLDGENIQFWKHPTTLVVSAAMEGMDLTPVSCFANSETIFRPTLKFELQNGPVIHDDEGSDIKRDLPCFLAADKSDGNSRSSCDNQTCNISDFYISDMVLANIPFDETTACDDTAKTYPFPEYDTSESNMLFDASERCMSLSSLDDPVDFSDVQIDKMDLDDLSLFLAIHQMSHCGQGYDVDPYADLNAAECFDPHLFIKNLPELLDAVPTCQPPIMPRESQKRNPITLVLDLDETLVHSTLEHCEDADFTFTVSFNMKEHTFYVKQRPYLRTFLERVSKMFEIFVFTASQSIYAEQLLDILDPDGKLISGRAYRESCSLSDGIYTKDLTVLGVDLAKVIIIDNCPQVFRLQLNNGIPIKSWFDDPSDNELILLLPFLEMLVDADDVRPVIAKRFGVEQVEGWLEGEVHDANHDTYLVIIFHNYAGLIC
ncbi:hypothetical protein Nepgr_007015 [Nepenthes gracilis]|uniref:FCP1 homology domain-containing protein n=1 Tax=Nepenthes gracilis TaxID=150966 RepID=A0AAD3XHZ3_NEPGR|nr:hypothetical protein Nepgr_007015 [Nepenthes gracilis]